MTTPGGDDSTYVYDALGYQVSSTQNGQQVNNLIDPSGLGNIVGQYSVLNSLISRYTYGLQLTSDSANANGLEFFDFDGTGNTSEVTNANGTPVDTYSYDPFGTLLQNKVSNPNPFQFVGSTGVMNTNGNIDLHACSILRSLRWKVYSPRSAWTDGRKCKFLYVCRQ